jgi:hypothetical protein
MNAYKCDRCGGFETGTSKSTIEYTTREYGDEVEATYELCLACTVSFKEWRKPPARASNK